MAKKPATKKKAPAKKLAAKKKHAGGRPTVFTVEVIQKLEEVAALDGSPEEMAHYAGISRSILYDKLANDKEFSDRIADLRERPVLKARQTIVSNLSDPNHAKWYLERKRKKEWAQRNELTGAEGKAIKGNTIVFTEFDDDEAESQ